MRKLLILPLLLASLMVSGTGCVQVKKQSPGGGVFLSGDKGNTWSQKVFIRQEKKKVFDISNVNVVDFEFDKADSKVIYIGTGSSGGFMTEDGGETWKRFGPGRTVHQITINPKNPDEFYVTAGDAIFKSVDRAQSWNMIYTEPRGVSIAAMEVDNYSPERLYVALADGQLMKSKNSGRSWTVLKHFGKGIKKMLIDPRDTRKIYIFTVKNGLFKTTNLGKDWVNIKSELADNFENSLDFKDAIFDFSQKDTILHISAYGILRTENSGASWKAMSLVTPPNSIEIFTAAIHPKDPNVMFYTTLGKIYRTDDGGGSWIVILLPTGRKAGILKFTPQGNSIYMGMQMPPKPKKKGFF